MKILTWELERLQKNSNETILKILESHSAFILILTETSSKINHSKLYENFAIDNLKNGYDGIINR